MQKSEKFISTSETEQRILQKVQKCFSSKNDSMDTWKANLTIPPKLCDQNFKKVSL